MKIEYYTKKKSIYIQKVEGSRELWSQQDENGVVHSLAEGVHITVTKLQKLVGNFPLLRHQTFCFGIGAEKELFQEARKERLIHTMNDEPTIILFLREKKPGKYAIGCSSLIEQTKEFTE